MRGGLAPDEKAPRWATGRRPPATCYSGAVGAHLRGKRKWLIGAAVVTVAAIAAVAVAGGGDEPSPPVAEERPEPPARPVPEGPDEQEGANDKPEDPVDEPPRIDEDELSREQRRVARTVRAYVEGLDARDGEAVCDLLAPGVIDDIELPRERGGCAESLSASIGYRDPRGLPVWAGARVQGLLTVALDGERASVTATTLTHFADRDQPSIEDDVVHLRRHRSRWLIAKPSATLYRAVGIADVPPRVLAPPK